MGRMNGEKSVKRLLHGREFVVASTVATQGLRTHKSASRVPTMWRRQTQPEWLSLCKLGVLSHTHEEKQKSCCGLEKETLTLLGGDTRGENRLFLYRLNIMAAFPSQ